MLFLLLVLVAAEIICYYYVRLYLQVILCAVEEAKSDVKKIFAMVQLKC